MQVVEPRLEQAAEVVEPRLKQAAEESMPASMRAGLCRNDRGLEGRHSRGKPRPIVGRGGRMGQKFMVKDTAKLLGAPTARKLSAPAKVVQ